MSNTIKLLESIGQNASLKEFDTLGQLLAQQNISEAEIKALVNSNTPLVCAWEPEDDDENTNPSQEIRSDTVIN